MFLAFFPAIRRLVDTQCMKVQGVLEFFLLPIAVSFLSLVFKFSLILPLKASHSIPNIPNISLYMCTVSRVGSLDVWMDQTFDYWYFNVCFQFCLMDTNFRNIEGVGYKLW